MIDPQLAQGVNDIRTGFLEAIRLLGQAPSFTSLRGSSDSLRAEFEELQRIAVSPRVQQPCAATFTCALVGSSGDGKTSIMAELFPDLAKRGWLQTDKTDTTSQALVVRQAPVNSAALEDVLVDSWSVEQITRLVKAAEDQNADARIIARYLPSHVEVDGSEAIFAADDRQNFKFDVRQQLRPLPGPYRLSPQERSDPCLIRTLTVKEESKKVIAGPVLTANGQGYNTLQLRAAVKAICLNDSFQDIARWANRPAEAVAGLVFVDTPGLNTSGSIKDEVLRNVLGKKNQQIVIELLRNDELDLIVHLVLCGNQSAFSQLWRAVSEQCEPDELTDLGDRLVLAVNGTNLYFTNPDLKRKWADFGAAQIEGDPLSITIEDNILKKMSERGTVRPARVCFLDSRRIVEAGGSRYEQVYATFRPVLESWCRPGGVGHETLSRLGILETFPQNIQALCDPTDRGQGFLIRQILELAKEKGPRLFLRKHLRRSRLHFAVKKLHGFLLRYYDAQGQLNRQAIQEAVRLCLGFLNSNDLNAIERFARSCLDPDIARLVPGPDAAVQSPRWFSDIFNQVGRLVFQEIIRNGKASREAQALFAQHYQERINTWKSQWGYRTAQLPPPSPQQPGTADLLRHCLKFHVREMLYQLQVGDRALEGAKGIAQSPQDKESVQKALALLNRVVGQADRLCDQFGVPKP